jgi:hypothetical protein
MLPERPKLPSDTGSMTRLVWDDNGNNCSILLFAESQSQPCRRVQATAVQAHKWRFLPSIEFEKSPSPFVSTMKFIELELPVVTAHKSDAILKRLQHFSTGPKFRMGHLDLHLDAADPRPRIYPPPSNASVDNEDRHAYSQ